VLRVALASLGDRISVAFVYGSVASGAERRSSDIDVMVVGSASFEEVVRALHASQGELRSEINPTVFSVAEFKKKAAEKGSFVARVLRDPSCSSRGRNMTLENLLRIGKLKPHKTTREEVARLLAAMRRNLKDAHNAEISPESRFDIAYKAVTQCAVVAMMTNGYRPSTNEPGHHATVVQSLPTTIGLTNDRMIVLDQLRKKRNLSDYSGAGITEEEAAACVRAAEELATAVD
jgi:predicted nucleotidyltransferase